MGFLQKSLDKRLRKAGFVTSRSLAFPDQDMLMASDLLPAVRDVYKQLGGVLDEPAIKFRKWELEYEGIAIELDEYLSFNRYRTLTLQSPAYAKLPLFPLADYTRYCAEHEENCLKAGRTGDKWSTEPAEHHFGPAAQPGDLDDAQGAPRWKQRAFYDFVKDLSPLLCNVQVVRLSIWDTVEEGGNTRTLLDVLKEPAGGTAGAIAKLIEARSN